MAPEQLFLLIFGVVSALHFSNAESKCTAVCYITREKLLACTLISKLPSDDKILQPVNCQKKEYMYSTEIIVGSFEDIDGVEPNGLDVFYRSEGGISLTKLQLTLKLKIKMVGPGLFDKLKNLQRLELHPLRVNPCAFYTLPKSVKQILIQCVSQKMKMLDDLYWPTMSNISFKINMCLQEVTCYACQPTKTTPFKYSLLKSRFKGPLSLNKLVSLKKCIPARCEPEVSSCLPAPTTTMTTTSTTTKKLTTTTLPLRDTTVTVRPMLRKTTIRNVPATSRKPAMENTKHPATSKTSPSRTEAVSERSSEEVGYTLDSRERPRPAGTMQFKNSEMTPFLMLVVLGVTLMNTLILLILVCLITYVSGCCRKKQRGIFLMPKDNFPPEYSTLRPV